MKIDIYSHIVPKRYWDAVVGRIGTDKLKKLAGASDVGIERTSTLWNLDDRFQIMDRFGDLVQVLIPSGPPLELFASPQQAIELAKLYNDEMAELVIKHPDRFVAAVAYLPLNNIEGALTECHRTINELRFKGVFLQTPIYVSSATVTKPIDIPDLMPLYEMMSRYDLPIWLHPRREHIMPDYTTEDRSKYVIHQMFGWPYETTVAMARLVYSGIFDHFPNLKVITHHCGAMVPYFAERIVRQCEWYEKGLGANFLKRINKPPIDYFHKFYADTAIYDNTSALMCGYTFFGADHILFGTDMPYDAEFGDKSIRDSIHAIQQMEISTIEKQKIFEGNAKELLKLEGSEGNRKK